MIILDDDTYVLEPVPQSATNDHLLYLLKDVQSEPFTCGVNSEDASSAHGHDLFNTGLTMTSLLRVRKMASCSLIYSLNRVKSASKQHVVVSTEKAQFTPNQLCGTSAGCGSSQGGLKHLFSSLVCTSEFVSFRLDSSTHFSISPLNVLYFEDCLKSELMLYCCPCFEFLVQF